MQDKITNLVSTTPTNRVVVNTQNVLQSQYLWGFAPSDPYHLVIDWIQCTIFDHFGYSERDYFYILFGISPDDVVFENQSLFSYTYTYSYKNIKILSSDDDELGYHLYITGSGCRNLEELNIDYKSLFKRLIQYNCKFTRLDVSIDDFSNKYFDIKKLVYYINNGLVRSKFKSTIHFNKTGINDQKLDGNTIWFGSRSSQIMVCFYDKLQERTNNNYIIDDHIKHWIRTEVRFRDLKAHEFATRFSINDEDINCLLKGILINYIQFLKNPGNDSNKSRWPIVSWWSDFTDNVCRLRLSSLPLETSISKKKSWLNYSVSKSEFAVLVSNIPNLTSDKISIEFLYNMFILGSDKIKDKDLQFINEYRESKGFNPLTLDDIDDFVRSIKDVLLTIDNKKNVNGKTE